MFSQTWRRRRQRRFWKGADANGSKMTKISVLPRECNTLFLQTADRRYHCSAYTSRLTLKNYWDLQFLQHICTANSQAHEIHPWQPRCIQCNVLQGSFLHLQLVLRIIWNWPTSWEGRTLISYLNLYREGFITLQSHTANVSFFSCRHCLGSIVGTELSIADLLLLKHFGVPIRPRKKRRVPSDDAMFKKKRTSKKKKSGYKQHPTVAFLPWVCV